MRTVKSKSLNVFGCSTQRLRWPWTVYSSLVLRLSELRQSLIAHKVKHRFEHLPPLMMFDAVTAQVLHNHVMAQT